MDVSLTISSQDLINSLNKLKLATGKSTAQVLKQQARLVAVSLAYSTQPYGDDGQPLGISAIKRDVSKVYGSPTTIYAQIKERDEAMAKGFYGLIEKGKVKQAQELLLAAQVVDSQTPIGSFDGGEAHKASRNSVGRVSRRRAALIVSNPDKIRTYIEKCVKLVGFAKGGWAACARQLGGVRGIPGWVSRQKDSPGEVIDKSEEAQGYIILVNKVKYISRCLGNGEIQRALDIEAEKMIKYIDRLTAANIRDADL